jgi:hypothetical protein
MCIFLTSARTGIPETNALLTKLMRFIIHRGALVTLFQTVLLITFYAMPDRLVWAAIHLNTTKLYATTFFAMLNGRQHLKPNVSQCRDMSTFEAAPPKGFASRPSSATFSASDRSDRTFCSVSAV